MKPVLTTGDVAKYCGVSLSTVFRWIKEGYLPAYTTPGGHHRILLSEFRAFLERNEMPIHKAFFAEAEAKRRILIVDDDPQIAEMIPRILADFDDRLEFASAKDGFEAGMLMTSFRPHLLILDLVMPRVDGFQMCRQIRANPDTAEVKILAITGFAGPENREHILTLGADGYLEKPLNTEALVEKVGHLLGIGTQAGARVG